MALPEIEIIRMGVITCDLKVPTITPDLKCQKKKVVKHHCFHQITKQAQKQMARVGNV